MTDFTGSEIGDSVRARLAKNTYDVGFFGIVAAITFGLSIHNGRGAVEDRALAAAWTAMPDILTGLAIWLANASRFLSRNGLVRYLVIGVPAFFVAALIRNLLSHMLGA